MRCSRDSDGLVQQAAPDLPAFKLKGACKTCGAPHALRDTRQVALSLLACSRSLAPATYRLLCRAKRITRQRRRNKPEQQSIR